MAPRSNKPRPDEAPAVEAEPVPVIVLTDAPKAPLPRERLLLLEMRVLDPQYIILDLSSAQI